VNKAIVSVDLDFFTKPYYIGNYYQEKNWNSKSDFKSTANRWLHTQDFISNLHIPNKRFRGAIVKEDNQPLLYWNNLIESNWIKPQTFDIVYFDAHSDMYKWHDDTYYLEKSSLSEYHPFETMIGALQQNWAKNIIWVHPDYVTPDLPDLTGLDIKTKFKTVQWSDWNWQNHEIWYLIVITNSNIAIINDDMINDFKQIIQEW
jgi:hypothetical protein